MKRLVGEALRTPNAGFLGVPVEMVSTGEPPFLRLSELFHVPIKSGTQCPIPSQISGPKKLDGEPHVHPSHDLDRSPDDSSVLVQPRLVGEDVCWARVLVFHLGEIL